MDSGRAVKNHRSSDNQSGMVDPPMVQRWLKSYASQPKTHLTYRQGINLWLTWCAEHGVDPIGAERPDCDDYAAWLSTAPSKRGRVREPRTRARLLATVASLYFYRESIKPYPRTPFAHTRRPEVEQTGATDALDAEGARKLLAAAEAAGPRTYVAVSTMLSTAVRASGLLGILIEDLRSIDGKLIAQVTLKGGKRHDLPLPEETASAIEALRGERTSGYLLQGLGTRESSPWGYRALHEAVVKAGEAAGCEIRVTPHVCRATFATLALGAGKSPAWVRAMMGHASVNTTLRYDQRADELKRKVETVDAVASILWPVAA